MAEVAVKVDWYGERVALQLKEAGADMLLAIGLQIEAQTKINIVNNGQVDTGFMLNSVYTTDGSDKSTYGTAQRTAEAQNGDERMAPEVAAGEGVAVAVGAEYAVHQETKNSFLYRAVEQVAGGIAEAEIRRIAKEQGLT